MAKAAMHYDVSGRWSKITLKKLVKACTNKEFFIFYKIFVDKTFGFGRTNNREGEMPNKIELINDKTLFTERSVEYDSIYNFGESRSCGL